MKNLIIAISILSFSSLDAQVSTLKESIFFGIGKSSLTRTHKDKLDSIIVLLKASKSYDGDIKGFTCSIGSTSLNKLISNLRALNVYNYLVDRGAKPKSFTYKGYGTDLKGDNSSLKGRILNRRTDIEVLLSLFDESNSSTQSNAETTLTKNPTSTNLGSNSETNTATTDNPKGANPSSLANALEIGPEFNSGKLPMAGNKIITSTNGIKINLDKNTFVSTSKEPIELDFKDYTQNYDIIKKGIQTKSNGKEMKLMGAFNVSFTQDYQELPINSTKPVIVKIPGDYDPELKLYSNHRNWQIDSVNKFRYNDELKAYEISVIDNSQMIGLLKPVEPEVIKYLKVKIKGVDPELIKPYIIYENCNISMGHRLKGKWFLFPITQISEVYRLRGQHIDYSSKSPVHYSLEFDVKNLAPIGNVKPAEKGETIQLKLPSKIFYTTTKLLQANLCDMPIAPTTNK